jgi:hypothetical protein
MPLSSLKHFPAQAHQLLTGENSGFRATIASCQKSSAQRSIQLAQDVSISTLLASIRLRDGQASLEAPGTPLRDILVARMLHLLTIFHVHDLPLLHHPHLMWACLFGADLGTSTNQRARRRPVLRLRNSSLACLSFRALKVRISTFPTPARVQAPATTTAIQIWALSAEHRTPRHCWTPALTRALSNEVAQMK